MGSVADTSIPAQETELSRKYDELEGTGPEPYAAFQALKEKIRLHYDVASDYYLSLWGEHIHHGYFTSDSETKEEAQVALINLLLAISSAVPTNPTPSAKNDNQNDTTSTPTTSPSRPALRILDVGCGVGGTTRHLARTHGAHVTGITISAKQVEIATRLSIKERTGTAPPSVNGNDVKASESISIGSSGGTVTFREMDAEKMGEYFSGQTNGEHGDYTFDVVWISEALSHFPNKALFFKNAMQVLRKGGKLVIADWFKDEGLTERQFEDDVKPIEVGMLLPPLSTQGDYVRMAEDVGFRTFGGPKDISGNVSKTWDISWSLVQNPSLWAFAFSQGRDGIAFLQAFRAMRRGYANGTFRYAVMAFEK